MSAQLFGLLSELALVVEGCSSFGASCFLGEDSVVVVVVVLVVLGDATSPSFCSVCTLDSSLWDSCEVEEEEVAEDLVCSSFFS